jgi:hypothetical protein
MRWDALRQIVSEKANVCYEGGLALRRGACSPTALRTRKNALPNFFGHKPLISHISDEEKLRKPENVKFAPLKTKEIF